MTRPRLFSYIKTVDELWKIRPYDFCHTVIDEESILYLFDLCDASWVHDENPERPHAELTSGKCSNGFFDCMRVLKYPNICELLARQFFLRFGQARSFKIPQWVIGSPYAAITFSHEVAKLFHAVHGFCEKDPERPKEFLWRRLQIPEGARVLQIEELVTTSQTFQNVRKAVEQGNPNPVEFLPNVGALVHRPPKLPVDYNGRQVMAVIEREIWAVEPSECPLCKAGSKRLRPKTHWKELTGKS